MDPRKEGKERGGAGGPSVLQAPRLALEVAEAQSHAASPQRAQAEPRHRGQPYPPRRGWAAPRRGPGAWTGEEGSPRRERTGPRPRAQLRFPSRLFKALYVVQIFILAGEGLRAGAGWGHWLSPQSHFSLQLPPRAPRGPLQRLPRTWLPRPQGAEPRPAFFLPFFPLHLQSEPGI